MGRDLQLRGRISAWGYHSKAFLFLLSFVNITLFGAVDVNDTWHACTHTSVATGKIAFWTGVLDKYGWIVDMTKYQRKTAYT